MIAYVNLFKRGYVPRGLGSSSQKVDTSLPWKNVKQISNTLHNYAFKFQRIYEGRYLLLY